jgi:DNA-binding LytR/AlgR family response regulator
MSTGILYLGGIVVFPYVILTQAIQLHILGGSRQPVPADDKSLVRFHDDQKRLKFIISSPAILYIEAEDNYVHIVHLDNGKVKDYSLRSSMRALEDLLSKHGMVRCHRSYFVNPDHVELVKKDVNGYALAQLDRSGLDPVPVSKKYYDSLSALL